MAGYDAGEDLLVARIKSLNLYSTANVTAGDWRVLDSGDDVRYAVAKPGTSERIGLTMASTQDFYRTIVECYRFMSQDLSDEALLKALEADVQLIADKLTQSNRLGDAGNTITLSRAMSLSEVDEIYNNEDRLEYLRQDITVEWWEERTISYAD